MGYSMPSMGQKQHSRTLVLGLLTFFGLSALILTGSQQPEAVSGWKERLSSYQYPPPRYPITSKAGAEEDDYPAFGPRNLTKAVARAEELWQVNLDKRKAYVESKGGYAAIREFSDPTWKGWGVSGTVWDIFIPTFPCPWETERIGVMADGGKYLCGLPRIEQKRGKKCVVYSFGVEQESSFESELLERTGCEIFMYDFSVESYGPQIRAMNETMQSRAHFHKLGLGAADETMLDGNKLKTLKTHMEQNGHDWIDILKVDVEGAEFTSLLKMVEDFGDGNLPFGQLLLEIHSHKTKTPYNTVEFGNWWEALEKAGLRAFYSELNYPAIHWLEFPSAMEMNFLNNCNGRENCGTLLREN